MKAPFKFGVINRPHFLDIGLGPNCRVPCLSLWPVGGAVPSSSQTDADQSFFVTLGPREVLVVQWRSRPQS
jgi:hypothetical protein